MAELRWLLLGFGLVAVLAIYLYTRFKPRLEQGMETLRARREPVLGSEAERQVSATATVPVAEETITEHQIESEPVADEPERSSDETKIVTIRLMSHEGDGFPGEKLVLKMRELGLQHGEFGIFHRPAEAGDLRHEFSVASLVEPGSFDLTKIRASAYPGVSIFMMLPGTRDGVEIFDDMMQTSRTLAKYMDGELLDEQGSSLSVQRERYLREEIIQFEHQGVS